MVFSSDIWKGRKLLYDSSPFQNDGYILSYDPLDLEKPPNPPDLPRRIAHDNTKLEYTPPFNSWVCAFSCVAVVPLPDDNVLLLVLDLT